MSLLRRHIALVAVVLAVASSIAVPLVVLAPGDVAAAPSSPPVIVCGNASLLNGPSTAPAGAVSVPAGLNATLAQNWKITANTTYWFAPGVHTLGPGTYTQISPATGDTFLGAPGATLTGQGVNQSAFSSHAKHVSIEYLTIRRFTSPEGQMVVNHTGAATWTVKYDTIQDNGGAGVGLASGSVVEYDCLTHNQEYGFSSFGGSYGITLSDDEVSFNDVTGQYDHGPPGITCGCSGAGKFWDTENAVVTDNYVHTNGSAGIWVDTDNAGFDISDNYISNNFGEGIFYEISYNGLIADNTLIENAVGAGPTVHGFPAAAIYISESGGDSRIASTYSGKLTITGNVLTNNWGGVVLWENSNRYCGDGSDSFCTLATPSTYSLSSCPAHLKGAKPTQKPDYYDNCRWKTQNVTVTQNTFNFTPSLVGSACTAASFCGFNGLFSEYGTTTPWKGWAVPLHISDGQNNRFLDNTYNGPWHFDGFDQGETVSWTQWSKGFTDTNGSNDHFNAQDAGSTYNGTGPPPPPPSTGALSLAPPAQTLTAGVTSAAMSVHLSSPAPAGGLSVKVTTSSTHGSFLTATKTTTSASLTLPVPANGTATPNFFYEDTKAGDPTLAASASGWTTAAQVETVGPGALARIAVSPATSSLAGGGTQTFRASGFDAYTNPVTAGLDPAWSSTIAGGRFSPSHGTSTVFTAPATSATGTVDATQGTMTGRASVTVTATVLTATISVGAISRSGRTYRVPLTVTVTNLPLSARRATVALGIYSGSSCTGGLVWWGSGTTRSGKARFVFPTAKPGTYCAKATVTAPGHLSAVATAVFSVAASQRR